MKLFLLTFLFALNAHAGVASSYVDPQSFRGTMTTTQRDALLLKKEGMVVYNTTDSSFQLYTSGSWTNVGGALSTGATKALDNLASTAVNADIIPVSNNTKALGSSSKRWATVWSNVFSGNNALFDTNSGLTTPSGIASASGMYSSTSTTVHTLSSAAADANATATLYLETGNKTAGTGNSGDIKLTTGTSAGGAQGKVIVVATAFRFPTASADPASGAVEGDAYENTSTHKLRVYNGTIWTDAN